MSDPWIIRTEAMHHGHRATLWKPRRTWIRKRLRYRVVAQKSSTFIDSERAVINRLLRRVPATTQIEVNPDEVTEHEGDG